MLWSMALISNSDQQEYKQKFEKLQTHMVVRLLINKSIS